MESPVNSSKTKYESPSPKDLHKVGDVKNRGWPKGKKRYPKSPGAPKQPLSGYVHFLNDRREDVRKESPDMSFAEISKKLASEWSHLGQEEKQKYAERADLDKERYSQEFLEYQQTDDYKEFVAQQEAAKTANGDPGKAMPLSPSKKSKKSKKKDSETMVLASNEDSRSSCSSMDIPIFQEQFLELNKAREADLRSLKNSVREFEEQNSVLQRHVDNMRSAVTKLERDVALTKENNGALEHQFDVLKKSVIKHFSRIHVPNIGTVNNDNVEEYVMRLLDQARENPQLKEAAKAAVSNIDLHSLATSFNI